MNNNKDKVNQKRKREDNIVTTRLLNTNGRPNKKENKESLNISSSVEVCDNNNESINYSNENENECSDHSIDSNIDVSTGSFTSNSGHIEDENNNSNNIENNCKENNINNEPSLNIDIEWTDVNKELNSDGEITYTQVEDEINNSGNNIENNSTENNVNNINNDSNIYIEILEGGIVTYTQGEDEINSDQISSEESEDDYESDEERNQSNNALNLNNNNNDKIISTLFSNGYYININEEPIGTGGYGTVRKVKNIRSGEEYVVKIIQINYFNREEARILKFMNHDFIIKLENEFFDENYQYLIFPLEKGGILQQYVNSNGPVNETLGKLLFYQILIAVNYDLKLNILNCDNKLPNILLDETFTKIKIIDFGVAVQPLESIFDYFYYVEGVRTTVGYRAPEIYNQGREDVIVSYNSKVESFAIGHVLFYMLTGFDLPISNLSNNARDLIETHS